MGFVQLLFVIMIMLIMPLAAGHLLAGAAGLYQDRNTDFFAFRLLSGYFLELAVFEAFAVIMIMAECSFSSLITAWCAGMVAVLALCAFAAGRTDASASGDGGKTGGHGTGRDAVSIVLAAALIALIAWQLCRCVGYTYLNEDDAIFLTPALDTIKTNTLMRIDAMTGELLDIPFATTRVRDIISPFVIFIALLSRLTSVHPAVMAHSVMPVFLLAAGYAAFWLISGLLFREKLRARLIFMLLSAEILMFLGGGTRTQGVAALIRLWQGKSVVAAVAAPALLFLLLLLCKSSGKDRRAVYIMIFICDMAACAMSAVGVIGIPLFALTFGIWYAAEKKEPAEFGFILMSMTPSLICAVLNSVIGF